MTVILIKANKDIEGHTGQRYSKGVISISATQHVHTLQYSRAQNCIILFLQQNNNA